MNNRRLKLISALAAALLGVHMPTAASAQTPTIDLASETRMPLVVVRFNQADVRFDNALSGAVKRAVAAKADVAFDVVVRPALASSTAEGNMERVSAGIMRAGIASTRISKAATANTGKRFDEVLVFVR